LVLALLQLADGAEPRDATPVEHDDFVGDFPRAVRVMSDDYQGRVPLGFYLISSS
jgi:hypothetical protein